MTAQPKIPLTIVTEVMLEDSRGDDFKKIDFKKLDAPGDSIRDARGPGIRGRRSGNRRQKDDIRVDIIAAAGGQSARIVEPPRSATNRDQGPRLPSGPVDQHG